MRQRSRGMTFLGFLVLMAFIGVFVYAGIRLVPVYIEYLNISRTIEAVKTESGGADAIRNSIDKRFGVDDVHSITSKDVEIVRDGEGYSVHVAYDSEAPFLYNIGFIVHFDKTVHAGAGGP